MSITLKKKFSVRSPPTLTGRLPIIHNLGMVSESETFWAYTSLDFSGLCSTPLFQTNQHAGGEKKNKKMLEVFVSPQANNRRLSMK